MIDFSKQRYYSPNEVRGAFASHGIRLRRGLESAGWWWLSNEPKPWPTGALEVVIAPRDGKGSWGAKYEPYDARFGNVFVTYGGADEDLLQRVKAAVSDLR